MGVGCKDRDCVCERMRENVGCVNVRVCVHQCLRIYVLCVRTLYLFLCVLVRVSVLVSKQCVQEKEQLYLCVSECVLDHEE